MRSHGLQPIRLLYAWGFPGTSTGMGCHFLLQGIFLTQGLNPHLLHRQEDSLPLSCQESLWKSILCSDENHWDKQTPLKLSTSLFFELLEAKTRVLSSSPSQGSGLKVPRAVTPVVPPQDLAGHPILPTWDDRNKNTSHKW